MLLVLVGVLVLVLAGAGGSRTADHWTVGKVERVGAPAEEVPEVVEALAVGETDALGVGSHLVIGVLVVGGIVVGSVEHLSAQSPIPGDLIVDVEVANDVGGVGGVVVGGPDDAEVGFNGQTVVEQLLAQGHRHLFVAHLASRLVIDINVDVVGQLRDDVVQLVGDDVVVTAGGAAVIERVEQHQVHRLDEHFGLVGGVDHIEDGLLQVFGGIGQTDAETDVGVEELVAQVHHAVHLDPFVQHQKNHLLKKHQQQILVNKLNVRHSQG